MIGEIINDRYRLDAVLGHGGMGAVYRGHDLQLERDVAIKLLNQVVFIQDERERLLREAKLIAKLRHPNIVSVYDVGDYDGAPFFVMEFVDGGSLRDQPGAEFEDCMRIIIQICRGLACAHDQRITHRDLKPENVLLEKAGRVKLADFGIARSDLTRYTSEEQITGTANYMAPEVIKGEAVDARADLYSLGVIMYELTTGQLPFHADTLIELINKHLFDDLVPPDEINPDLPASINDLIQQLLSKSPEERPSSARDVQNVLETSLGTRDKTETLSVVQAHSPTQTQGHNLRIQPSSFIGRETELIQIQNYLGDTDCRLLTLVGIGGIGKTRLATQAAYDVLENFPDGVWMVELASLAEANLLAQKVALLFGVSAQEAREGHDETDVLVDYLKEKNLLLVIDNCEHLIDACAQFADILLQGCTDLKVLATSREDLRIPGEILYHVSPMELPPEDTPPEKLETYEAIQLFIERAGANQPKFNLTKENGSALAQICRQLDGIPLAIELAAARIKVLSPNQIADRLEHRFQLLTGGSRTALPRHQTLEAAIDWSYDLLTKQEQFLFRRLAVFSGGWTIETAENVVNLANENGIEVLDLFSQLVDKSLVLVEELDNTRRYRFLETVRQYGINKLKETGELQRARQAHLDYFVRLAEKTDAGLRGEGQIECLAVLDAEHDNLRGALRWSLNQVNAKYAFRLIAALGWYWFMRGYWKESWIWLRQSIDLKVDSSPILRAKAVIRAGGLELIRGKLSGTTELVEQALTASREANDQESTAWCLNLLGQAGTWGYKDIDEAEANLLESIEIFKALGDDWGVTWSLRYLGQVTEAKGDYEESISLQRESLDRFERVGDIWNSAHSLYLLGGTLYLFGDDEAAKTAYKQSLVKCKDVEDKVMAAHAIRGLGLIALQRDDLDQAEELLQEGLEALQKIGDDHCVSGAISDLGEIARRRGQYARANELLSESLFKYIDMGNDFPIWLTLERFAGLSVSKGEYETAVKLLAADEENIGDKINSSPTLHTRHKELVSTTLDHLGREIFEQYWSAGAELDLEQATELALNDENKE